MSFKSYHLATARRLVEDRQRLDAQVHVPLIQALEKLEDDSYRVERVQAKETGAWRLRLGDWRIRDDRWRHPPTASQAPSRSLPSRPRLLTLELRLTHWPDRPARNSSDLRVFLSSMPVNWRGRVAIRVLSRRSRGHFQLHELVDLIPRLPSTGQKKGDFCRGGHTHIPRQGRSPCNNPFLAFADQTS